MDSVVSYIDLKHVGALTRRLRGRRYRPILAGLVVPLALNACVVGHLWLLNTRRAPGHLVVDSSDLASSMDGHCRVPFLGSCWCRRGTTSLIAWWNHQLLVEVAWIGTAVLFVLTSWIHRRHEFAVTGCVSGF